MNNKTCICSKLHVVANATLWRPHHLVKEKASRGCAWKTEFFCKCYFLKKKVKINKNSLFTEQCFLYQNKSVCQKLAWCCKKCKTNVIWLKKWYKPSLHKRLNLLTLFYFLAVIYFSLGSKTMIHLYKQQFDWLFVIAPVTVSDQRLLIA